MSGTRCHRVEWKTDSARDLRSSLRPLLNLLLALFPICTCDSQRFFVATGMKLKSSKTAQLATESKKKRKPKDQPKTQIEEAAESDDNENHEVVESTPLNGWKRFVNEYNSSFHHVDELRARCLQVIEAHQEQLAELRAKGKSHRNEADDNGWVTVTNRKRVAKRKQHEQPKSKLLKLAEEARIRHRRPVTLV